MSDKYFTVNIRAYLDKDEPTYIGEESLYDLLSDFSCPKNPDVEYFLLHNAIEFTKKDQSITYLVFDAEDASLVGYFSLTVKPISVRASNISKTSVYKGYKQDKIEMRGDRAEMSDFPLYLNTVAGGLDRRDQTIGGFSFVVKIYTVPVVEIIG